MKFALAPLSRQESLRMIRGIQSYALLEGVRGEAGMDIDAMADNIQRLGRLVSDFPRIKEIDLNPIKGVGADLYAVDARIIVDQCVTTCNLLLTMIRQGLVYPHPGYGLTRRPSRNLKGAYCFVVTNRSIFLAQKKSVLRCMDPPGYARCSKRA